MIYFARVDISPLRIWYPGQGAGNGPRRPERMVYFIKIGKSVQPAERIQQLAAQYGRNVTLLATLPGGPEEERRMHARFAHLRMEKSYGCCAPEWFYPTRELMDFIRSLQESEKIPEPGLDVVMSSAYYVGVGTRQRDDERETRR